MSTNQPTSSSPLTANRRVNSIRAPTGLPNRNSRVLAPETLTPPSLSNQRSLSVNSSEGFNAEYYLNNVFSPKTEVALANEFVRHKRQAAETEAIATEQAEEKRIQMQKVELQARQQLLAKQQEIEEERKLMSMMEATLGLTRSSSTMSTAQLLIANDQAAALKAHRIAEKKRQVLEAKELQTKRVTALSSTKDREIKLESDRIPQSPPVVRTSPPHARRPSITSQPNLSPIVGRNSNSSGSSSDCKSPPSTSTSLSPLTATSSQSGTPSGGRRLLPKGISFDGTQPASPSTDPAKSSPIFRRGRSLSVSAICDSSSTGSSTSPVITHSPQLPSRSRPLNDYISGIRVRSNSISSNAESVLHRLAQAAVLPALENRSVAKQESADDSAHSNQRSPIRSNGTIRLPIDKSSPYVSPGTFQDRLKEVPWFVQQVHQLNQFLGNIRLKTGGSRDAASNILGDRESDAIGDASPRNETEQDFVNGKDSTSPVNQEVPETRSETNILPISAASLECWTPGITPAVVHSTFIQYQAMLRRCRAVVEEGAAIGHMTSGKMSEALAFLREHDKNPCHSLLLFEIAYEAGKSDSESQREATPHDQSLLEHQSW